MLQSFLVHKAKFLLCVSVCSILVFISSYEIAFGVGGTNSHIPFYGELNDADGAPLTGTYDMLFTIYDAPTGGNPLWTGNYTSANGNAVQVTSGDFSVMLGSGTGNAFSINFSDAAYYLGITIGTDDEMIPREHMGSAPSAVNSEYLGGFDISSFVLKNTPIDINYANDSSLLTLTQTGIGDFVRMKDAGDTTFFSVSNTGRASATSFENLLDEVNTFAGPLSVMSGDVSYFSSSVSFGDGAGISFGNDNGLMVYQDTNSFGFNDLVLKPQGSGLLGGGVNITTPGGLYFTANNVTYCEGSNECSPSLVLSEFGTAFLTNTNFGDDLARYFDVDFTSGMHVTSGDLQVLSGNLDVAGTTTTTNLDVSGTVKVQSLSTGGANLELYADNLGNITTDPFSDERLKENIVSIGSALDIVLDLRGVRYTWRDTNRFGVQTEIGFIAQEVQEVIPEVVRDSGEYLTLNMKNIIPVVVEAIKELNTKVNKYFDKTDRLEHEVDALRAEIEALKGGKVIENDSQTTEEPVVSEDTIPEPEPEVVIVGEAPAEAPVIEI